MFSSGSSGFYKSPVSKTLLLIYGSSSLAHLLLRKDIQDLFRYSIDNLIQQSQLWRVVTSHLVVCEVHVLILVLLLLYNFRILERRYGSHKYASHIFANSFMASSLNLVALADLHWLGYTTPTVHSAVVGTLGSLFIPLFCDVPNIPVQSYAGSIPGFMQVFTGKVLVYLLGLQLAISSTCAPLQFLTGMLAGVLYRCDLLRMKSYLVIPKSIANLSGRLLGPLIESRPPRTDPYPHGATIDIQRQIRTDYMEQRWMLLQARQNRQARNGRQQFTPYNFFQRRQALRRPLPPTPFQFLPRGGEINGNFANGGSQNHGGPSTSSSLPPVVISEERVQQLVDMGFDNSAVRTALEAANNDISRATNILLQE